MCSNFGFNMHPGRKPAALQWEWYNFAMRLYAKVRERLSPTMPPMVFELNRFPAKTAPAKPECDGARPRGHESAGSDG